MAIRIRLPARLTKMLLFAAALLLLYLAGSLLFFNATPKEIRVTETIEAPYSVRDPQFRRESGQITGRRWVDGNSIEILDDGRLIFDSMLRDIRNATCCITKETYNFWGEDVATPFSEALAEAANRGLHVHFLMDYVGSINATRAQLDTMSDAGVQIARWREPAWYQLSRFNHRTHRKILVIDGATAYVGGANTSDPWLPGNPDGGYKDYHYRLTGPIVNEIQGAFSENWVSARGELLLGNRYYPDIYAGGSLPMQITSSHPREGQKRMRKMLMHAMASADESIRIGSAYFFPDRRFLQAIMDASQRGVDIRILVPGEEIDQKYLRYASRTLFGDLLTSGVEIYEYQPSMYHAKKLIVDEHFVSVGSSNFDNRSFRLNDELNVNILDSDFGQEMAHRFDQDLARSVPVTLEDWETRPLGQRMWGWIVRITLGAYL